MRTRLHFVECKDSRVCLYLINKYAGECEGNSKRPYPYCITATGIIFVCNKDVWQSIKSDPVVRKVRVGSPFLSKTIWRAF